MQPAGSALENVTNPIGLYRHAESNTEVGCTDPSQADAAVRVGYVLVKQFDTSREVAEAAVDKAPAATAPSNPAPAKEPEKEVK